MLLDEVVLVEPLRYLKRLYVWAEIDDEGDLCVTIAGKKGIDERLRGWDRYA